MGRARDHYPRFDATVCPDRAACRRLYHVRCLMPGDVCECCGEVQEVTQMLMDRYGNAYVGKARHDLEVLWTNSCPGCNVPWGDLPLGHVTRKRGTEWTCETPRLPG